MAAKEEELLHLFDLYWFKRQVLRNPKPFSVSPNPSQEEEETLKPEKASSLHVITPLSNQFLSSKDISYGGVESPNSVLAHSKIDTLLSGVETEEFSEEKAEQQPVLVDEGQLLKSKKTNQHKRKRRARRLSRFSKSLSDLEYEEIKGFMDLGFEFSEEDKESSRLISILPGLHRLGGGRKQGDHVVAIDGGKEQARAVSRPYLSEAWKKKKKKKTEFDGRREGKEENPPLMMNWRLPSLSNEIGMKNHLRMWAQTVASAVR